MLSRKDILALIDKAEHYQKKIIDKNKISNELSGRVVSTLFFEPSTRTCNSFLLAAKRLSAITLNPQLNFSAIEKGESLIDTIHTFEAMGVETFIIRHPEDFTPSIIAENLNRSTHIVNAGDGKNHHPTQALLDVMTIKQHKKDFEALTVAIVGDNKHSRVARSLLSALKIMGVPCIRFIAPPSLTNENFTKQGAEIFNDLTIGLKDADVIIALRIQKERLDENADINLQNYQKHFCVTKESIALAHPDAMIMHPGPMNRNIEISSDVADGNQSVILTQVNNGVAIRMAVLSKLMS